VRGSSPEGRKPDCRVYRSANEAGTTYSPWSMLPSVAPHQPGRAGPRAGRRIAAFVVLLLLGGGLFVFSGCASSEGERPAPASTTPSATTPAAGQALSAAEIEAIYAERIREARSRYTEADVHFMTAMIHHHAQAIEMSELAPERTSNSSIRTLAARIINAQADEIATMERWLADRGQPVPHLHHDHGDHDDHDDHDDHAAHALPGMSAMPGMLTAQQLRELAEARERAFDRLFLALMIEHHQGAVEMVSELVATDGAAQDEEVFRFASDVQVDQITEIARMERMLAELDPSHER
jgi:uncharacterized protein (DUF305 family)